MANTLLAIHCHLRCVRTHCARQYKAITGCYLVFCFSNRICTCTIGIVLQVDVSAFEFGLVYFGSSTFPNAIVSQNNIKLFAGISRD